MSIPFVHTALVALSALLAGSTLAAQENPFPRPHTYFGITLGTARTQQESASQGGRTPLNLTTLSLLGGVEYGRFWGGELGFHFLGDYPAGTSTDVYGTTQWTREVSGFSFAGTGRLHLGRRVALVGRAGVMFWSSRPRSSGNGWVTVTDGRDSGRSGGTPLLGSALQVDLTPAWVLRFDAEVLDRVMDARMTRWSAGFAYRF